MLYNLIIKLKFRIDSKWQKHSEQRQHSIHEWMKCYEERERDRADGIHLTFDPADHFHPKGYWRVSVCFSKRIHNEIDRDVANENKQIWYLYKTHTQVTESDLRPAVGHALTVSQSRRRSANCWSVERLWRVYMMFWVQYKWSFT